MLIYTRQDATHGRRLSNPDTVKAGVKAWCGSEGLKCFIKVLSHWPAESFQEQVCLHYFIAESWQCRAFQWIYLGWF